MNACQYCKPIVIAFSAVSFPSITASIGSVRAFIITLPFQPYHPSAVRVTLSLFPMGAPGSSLKSTKLNPESTWHE